MGWPFRKKRDMPEGLWRTCESCKKYLYKKQVEEAFDCCPECGEHFRVTAERRIALTADEGTFEEIAADVVGKDILGFVDAKGPYAKKLLDARAKTKLGDAVVAGRCRIQGVRTVIASLDFEFLGGSMGHAVGEKVAIALETALDEGLPCVIFSASGGARMHEGAMSLMQMSKTSAAVHRFKERGRTPFVSVLTNPTTGGVTASYAALGDIILAEPKALIGFAGPRVIKQTIRQDLPEGFQTSEFLLEKGFVDMIVPRAEMRDTLAKLFSLLLPAAEG
jgi:acetyl-CoA carboxylase carboxyl transferase subunit beta